MDEPEIKISKETEFEKARGVNKIEIRSGLVGVQVFDLAQPVPEARITVLESVFDSKTNIDFLKLTADGMTFVCSESSIPSLTAALDKSNIRHIVRSGRSVLSVHAVNMRDEEGLVAKIVSEVIASGAEIEHLGDMHDRVLVLLPTDQANEASKQLQSKYPEATS